MDIYIDTQIEFKWQNKTRTLYDIENSFLEQCITCYLLCRDKIILLSNVIETKYLSTEVFILLEAQRKASKNNNLNMKTSESKTLN